MAQFLKETDNYIVKVVYIWNLPSWTRSTLFSQRSSHIPSMPWSPLIAGPSQHYNMRTCGSVCSFNMKSHIRSCHTCAKLLQLCLSLCNPMDCNPTGSSVNGILQERILGWVALASSRGSSQPRDQTIISYISCIGRQRLSCSTACGIFLDQGSNPCLLHWHEDSLPLSHKEAPVWFLNIHLVSEILSKHLLENIACDRICSNIFAHE